MHGREPNEMKQPESAIDVKMYEFGRLIDGVVDAAIDEDYDPTDKKSIAAARARYLQARERLVEAIRSAVLPLLTTEQLDNMQFGRVLHMRPERRDL